MKTNDSLNSHDLRLERAHHAVSLHAYYGIPACQLSDEQVVVWLGLVEEYHERTSCGLTPLRVRVYNAQPSG